MTCARVATERTVELALVFALRITLSLCSHKKRSRKSTLPRQCASMKWLNDERVRMQGRVHCGLTLAFARDCDLQAVFIC